MRFIYSFLFLFLLAQVNVQAQSKPFQNKIGYFDYDVTPWFQVVDSSGNHYVLGQFSGIVTMGEATVETKGDRDIYLVKYDSANNFQWIRSYGSPGQDIARSMSCDKDGNIYITGQYLGTPFSASPNLSLNIITQYQQSRFLMKINSAGVTQWAKRFSGTANASDMRSEVINDHEGRLYLIHPNRANGALNSWNYNDSIIANPTNAFINVPRWALARIDQANGNLKWVDYIANPNVSASVVTILNISRPLIDSKNNILFSVSHYGSHINPIYVFGQYAAVNPNPNVILVKIDSSGTVRKFRDLGASNNSRSDAVEMALTALDEPVLINRRAFVTTDGFYRDYWNNNPFNYARVYDTNFVLKNVVKLGMQNINSFGFDKQNRLTTLSSIGISLNGTIGGTETVLVDSTTTASIKTRTMSEVFFVRYKSNFALDTVFNDNRTLPFGGMSFTPNSLKFSSKGDVLIQTNHGLINNAVYRYTNNFVPKNTNYGVFRDMQENIQGIGEDSTKSVYVCGMVFARADFGSATGTLVYNTPIERGADIFIAKYRPDNTLAWIRRIGKSGNESPSSFRVGKDGIYLSANTGISENWLFDTTNLSFPGRQVVVKLDFNGNLVWTKEITNTGTGSFTLSSLNILRNGKVLVSGTMNGTVTISDQTISAVGNRANLCLAILDNISGQLVNHNKYALSNESLGSLSNLTSSFHEDHNGGIYFGIFMSRVTGATNNNTEIYSAKTKRIPFSLTWLNQHGLLKVDSSLEISKFKTFPSYFLVGNIGGIDSTIMFSAYGRGASFNYDTIGGVRIIPLHSYATDAHFTHFTGRLDTDLNIVEITKYDTTTVENAIDINSRRIIPDVNRNEIYETGNFTNSIKIDSTDNVISPVGSRDLLFLKYDRRGKLMGGQRLGTPQTDFFIAAAASSSGLIFSTQTVNPQYQAQFLRMKNVYEIKQNITNRPVAVSDDQIRTLSTTSTLTSNFDVLSPDNFVSRNLSLFEIGRKPDTTIIKTGSLNFCKGGTTYINVNEASSINWKKDGVLLNGQTSDSLPISRTGSYKAIFTTAEGRVDSTRAVYINVYEPPAAPVVPIQSICIGSTTTALTATASTGSSLRWYGTSATGGTASATAPTPSSSTAGVTNYYVSQISAEGCESERSVVAFTVHPKPTSPSVSAGSICETGTTTALTATASTGNTLRWYGTSATGGTASATAPTPSSSMAGVTNYYVSQVSTQGCESERSVVAFTVHPKPSSPSVSAGSICETGTTTALTATASTESSLRWYGTSATGGTASATAPTPSSSMAGVTNYYVSQVSTQGCESDRAVLSFTVHPKPAAPVVSPVSVCAGSAPTNLIATAATGNSLRWYGTSATGGTASATAPIPSSSTAGVTNYYVSQLSAQGCESDRTMLVYTVNTLPQKPRIIWNGTELVVDQAYPSYQWLLNNTVIAGATSLLYKPLNSGSYRVLVRNNAGCADTSLTMVLMVTALSDLSSTGSKVKIYPNPAKDKAILDLGKKPAGQVVINVLSAEGQLINTYRSKEQKIDLPVNQLSNGIYLISVQDGKKFYELKLIKQ